MHKYITGTDDKSIKYQDYFYGLFNWAVPTNSMKWRFMEGREVYVLI